MDEREPWIQALLHTVGEHASAVAKSTDPRSGDGPLRSIWPHEPDVIVLIDSALMISSRTGSHAVLVSAASSCGASRVSTRLPMASTRTDQPGSTTVVETSSTTSKGPCAENPSASPSRR